MPKRVFRLLLLVAVLPLLVAGLVVAGLAAKSKPKSLEKQHKDFSKYVEIPGAAQVGADQCAQCHAEVTKTFGRSQHSLRDVQCEQCHGAGSLHLVAGGYTKESQDKIVSFKDRTPEQANGACLSCHAKSDHVRNWFSGADAGQDIKCVDCHTIHGEKVAMESRHEQNARCLQCHRKQEAESTLPYHHPVREDKMSCIDCHDPHGGSGG